MTKLKILQPVVEPWRMREGGKEPFEISSHQITEAQIMVQGLKKVEEDVLVTVYELSENPPKTMDSRYLAVTLEFVIEKEYFNTAAECFSIHFPGWYVCDVRGIITHKRYPFKLQILERKIRLVEVPYKEGMFRD